MLQRSIFWLIPLAALFYIAVVINLIRQRKLLETHALLWLFTFLVVLVSPVFLPLLNDLAYAVGIYYPPALYLLIAIFFLMANTLVNTLDVSRLSEQNRRLTQEVAILREQIESQAAHGAPAGPGGGLEAAPGVPSTGGRATGAPGDPV